MSNEPGPNTSTQQDTNTSQVYRTPPSIKWQLETHHVVKRISQSPPPSVGMDQAVEFTPHCHSTSEQSDSMRENERDGLIATRIVPRFHQCTWGGRQGASWAVCG